MNGRISDRYATWLVEHSRAVVIAVLVVTALVAAGSAVGETEDAGIGEFVVDTEETAAGDYVEDRYDTDDRLLTQIVTRGEDVLSRDSLLESLRLQADARADESIAETLAEPGFVGFENLVASMAVAEDREADGAPPPDEEVAGIDEQIEALETRSDEEVEGLVQAILEFDADVDGTTSTAPVGVEDPRAFLAQDTDESDDVDARLTFLYQVDDSGDEDDPEAAYNAQLAVESIFEERFDDGFVFGGGITDAASASAVGDSFVIITPVALVLVLGVLGFTYRDVVDVLVALFGIGVVMAWVAGIMGWLEIPMSQLLIAVPFLLIGLSIDYALHVVMRYREARAFEDAETADRSGSGMGENNAEEMHSSPDAGEDGSGEVGARSYGRRPTVRAGMAVGFGGVVLALAAATVSTGVGFLSNVVSPLPAIRDFAVLSAGGIFATFVAFGILVPALKVEVDTLLERRFGRNRAKPAFGMTPGPVNRLLSGGVSLARRAPVVVVFVAFLLAVGGAYGATTIDTEFNEADFLPEDAPEWAKSLPGPFEPDTYTIADDAAYLAENFQDRGEGGQAEILIRDGVTDPDVLVTIEGVRTGEWGSLRPTEPTPIDATPTIDVDADGNRAIEGPTTALFAVAADDETVSEAIDERDETGDGLPNDDVATVFDLAYEADAETMEPVLERAIDGEYESMRLIVSVQGDAASQSVADDLALVAGDVERAAGVSAIPTGGPVETAVIQDALLETLVQAFAVTLVVILAFLTLLYWIRHRALTLGAIAIAPVVAALAWLLGTMALVDVPFNSETAVITSLAIGLGVDYSIHVTERFVAERDRVSDLGEALSRTVTGTGGALLGSATTTAAGFGVLALALAPPLQRFGLVTGLAIVFAFVACLTVLPCLLVVRERLLERRR